MQIPDLNPDSIPDLSTRQIVIQLLNLIVTGSWVATDQTRTRVDGQNEVCHVVGNACFTSDHTRPGGTRQDVLAVLWGQDLRYRLNDESLAWLQASSLPNPLVRCVAQALPRDTDMTAAELQQYLSTAGITPPLARRGGRASGSVAAVPEHGRDHAWQAAGAAGARCAGGCHLSRPNPGARARLVAER